MFAIHEVPSVVHSKVKIAKCSISVNMNMRILQRKQGKNMAIHEDDLNCEANTATYCPEDDKLRLYIDGGEGRVERDTYLFLRENGFKATPKQSCSFVATWTITREDICLSIIHEDDDIGDEDCSPQERAADRAERFSMYRDKRRSEAVGHADQYDAGPSVFGNQNQARAQAAANRHERSRTKGLSQWSKAEYWQSRTAGVIGNALYKSEPSVRRGRILVIEKEIRQAMNAFTPDKNTKPMQADHPYNDTNEIMYYIRCGSRGGQWVTQGTIDARKDAYKRYLDHMQMRLAYENQMIGDEGGQCSEQDIVPGGWIRKPRRSHARLVAVDGWSQVLSVKKSPATGRVTSVEALGTDPYGWGKDKDKILPRRIKVDRLGADAYRPPTDEELEVFNKQMVEKKVAKKAKAKANPKPSLINPTKEDALKLQEILNASRTRTSLDSKEEPTAVKMTQAEYSRGSKGTYARLSAKGITEKLEVYKPSYYGGMNQPGQQVVFKVRMFGDRVIVISDKPQKKLPFDRCAEILDSKPTELDMIPKLDSFVAAVSGVSFYDNISDEMKQVMADMRYNGLFHSRSLSQYGLTDRGHKLRAATRLQWLLPIMNSEDKDDITMSAVRYCVQNGLLKNENEDEAGWVQKTSRFLLTDSGKEMLEWVPQSEPAMAEAS